MTRSKRFERREERAVNRDTFVQEEASLGLMVMDSPDDPAPSIRLEGGRVVEIDGRVEAAFDVIDRYIARYAIKLKSLATEKSHEQLALETAVIETLGEEALRYVKRTRPIPT